VSDPDLASRLFAALVEAIDPDGRRLMALWAEGRSFTAIGRAMSIAPSTAHRRVHRIRAELAKHGLLPVAWREREKSVRPGANVSMQDDWGAA